MSTQVQVHGVSVFPLQWVEKPNKHHVYLTASAEFMAEHPDLASHLWDVLTSQLQADGWHGSLVIHVEAATCDETPFSVDALMSHTEDEAPGIGELRRKLEDWTMDAVARLAL